MMKRTISGMIGAGSLAHNRRDFVAENVDPDRVQLNIYYKNEDLKEVYKELFDDAVERYNVGKRKDRQIANYYEKIRQGKQEKLFHEVIFQIGNREDMAVGTSEGNLAVRIALYHFSIAQIKRSAGQSAIASAAYRAGERLYSSYYGEVSDYTKKGGVIASEIMLPPHAPEIYLDRATLWNAVENCEKHPKAQLAYSFDIAMQNELTLEENMELARKFVQEQFVTKGMIADLAFHSPEKEDGGIPNPHFHVMTTMRPLNPDGTWGQKQRREYLLDEDGNRIRDKNGDYMFNAVHTTDWHEPETLEHWREQWAAAVNTKFEEKGLDVRIDHRSYVRQGLDLIPTVHEGANVRQMEAKGIRTEKGELNRWIKATNRLMQDVRKKIKALFVWMAEVKEELSKPQTPSLADLLIAYYNQRNAGAWSNKARTGNLKQFAEAVNYLTENKLLTLEDLQERLSSVNEEFEALSDSMKKKSARIKELQELIREGENYQRLKPVHTELNNIKFKKQREKFETSHDAELRLFYAARRILKEKLDGKPIALKAWKQEYAQLKTEYAELSPQHKPLREEVIRLRQVQNAVDTALRRREQPQAVQRKKHEMEL